MKKVIPLVLTISLLLLVNNAMAERGSSRSNHGGYASQGERIEQHLDGKGDRIERRFDHKAAYAAEQGKYRQARHFQNKGKQINRHLDRKGERIHARKDHRRDYRNQQHRHYQPYPVVAYTARPRHHNNNVSVMIQQPGLWLGWGINR